MKRRVQSIRFCASVSSIQVGLDAGWIWRFRFPRGLLIFALRVERAVKSRVVGTLRKWASWKGGNSCNL